MKLWKLSQEIVPVKQTEMNLPDPIRLASLRQTPGQVRTLEEHFPLNQHWEEDAAARLKKRRQSFAIFFLSGAQIDLRNVEKLAGWKKICYAGGEMFYPYFPLP